MQNKRDSKSRLNSAAHQMLTNNISLRENSEGSKKYESQSRLEDLQMELQQKEMTLSALQRNYDGISRIYKEEKGKSSEWVEKVSSLEKENAILRSKIQTFESQKQKAMQELEKTQEELMKLLKGYDEVRSIKTEHQTIKTMFEKKKKECDEYLSKLEVAKSETEALKRVKIDLELVIKKIKSDMDNIDKEKAKLLQEFEEYKIDNIALENRYAEALNELDKVRNDYSKKNLSESNNEQQIVSLRQQLNSERSELSSIRIKYNEILVIVESLKDQLELKNSKLLNSEKIMADTIKDLSQKLLISNTENSKIIKQLENMQNLIIQVNNLQDEIKILNNESNSKNEELEKWKNEAKSLAENLNFVLKNSDSKAKQLEEEIRIETARKKEILNEKEEVIGLLSKKEQEYQKYLEDKEKYLSECKSKIDAFNKNLEMNSSEYRKLKEELLNTQQLYAITKKSLQSTLDENQKLKESISALIKEIEIMKQRLIEESESKNQYHNISEDISNEMKALKMKNHILSEENIVLQKENNNLKVQSEIFFQENLKIKKNLEEKETVLKASFIEISDYKKNIELLERDNHSLIEGKTAFELEISRLNKIISNINKELLGIQDTFNKEKDNSNKVMIQISAKDLEISRIQNMLLMEKSNYKSMVEENSSLVRRLQDMRDERDKMKNADEETQKKAKLLQERERGIIQVLERLENALNSLETNFSCHSCFNPLENAIVCIPCGHLHCGNCKPKINEPCKECDHLIKQTVSVSLFDEIYGKIVYKRQAIQDMKHLLNV